MKEDMVAITVYLHRDDDADILEWLSPFFLRKKASGKMRDAARALMNGETSAQLVGRVPVMRHKPSAYEGLPLERQPDNDGDGGFDPNDFLG